jgi:hypothetical protein
MRLEIFWDGFLIAVWDGALKNNGLDNGRAANGLLSDYRG